MAVVVCLIVVGFLLLALSLISAVIVRSRFIRFWQECIIRVAPTTLATYRVICSSHIHTHTHIHAHTVSPHIVIETVRLWLQEGLNSHKFERIVFCARANLPLLEEALDKYFPLLPFMHNVSPRLGEVVEEAPGNDDGEEMDANSPENYEKDVDKETPAKHKRVDEEAPANYKESTVVKQLYLENCKHMLPRLRRFNSTCITQNCL